MGRERNRETQDTRRAGTAVALQLYSTAATSPPVNYYYCAALLGRVPKLPTQDAGKVLLTPRENVNGNTILIEFNTHKIYYNIIWPLPSQCSQKRARDTSESHTHKHSHTLM